MPTSSRGCKGDRMSHVDPALVDVRTLADHPLVSNGATSRLRMVAPGSVTAGRYGLVEYHVAPHSPGAAPHFHQTVSETFYALSGTLTVSNAGQGTTIRAGDVAMLH